MAEPLPPHAHSPLPLAGSLTNGGSPLPLVAHAASQYMQLAVTIETARISHCSGGLTQLLKPSPYAELSVDGKPPKRTDICKSSMWWTRAFCMWNWTGPRLTWVEPCPHLHQRRRWATHRRRWLQLVLVQRTGFWGPPAPIRPPGPLGELELF